MEPHSLEEQLQLMHIEYNRKKRKLKRSRRSAEARAYVQQRLQEVGDKDGFGCLDEPKDDNEPKKDVETVPIVNCGKPDHNSELHENISETEDLFLSPVNLEANLDTTCTEIDAKLTIHNEKHVDTNNAAMEDSNDVVIMPPFAKTAGKQREKRLKLTKYRTKNFVNPLHNDQNLSAHNLENEKILSSLIGNRRDSTDMNMESESKKDKDGDDGTANYLEGQVIVFERNIDQSELDVDANNSKVVSNTCDSLLKSVIPIHSKSEDKSRNYDFHSEISSKSSKGNELVDVTNCEVTSARRRSIGRKRRISGIDGPQRRSSRLANISSQESTSSNETCVSPPFVSANKHCTKKSIILSSVFQCLVDEGKRQPQKEFSINLVEPICTDKNSAGKTLDIDSEDLFDSKNETDTDKSNSVDTNFACEELEIQGVADEHTESERVDVHETQEIDNVNGLSCSVEDCEVEEVRSPTLFESQGLIETLESHVSSEKKLNFAQSDNSDTCSQTCKSTQSQSCSMPATEQIIDDERVPSCLHLKPFSKFQVPSNDPIHSVCCDEVMLDGNARLFVVCLCSTSLKLYTCNEDTLWTCVASTKIPFTIRKKSGNVMYMLDDSETVSIILLGPMTNCTVLYCYSYHRNAWQQTVVDKIFCKSVNISPLPDVKMVVSYRVEKNTCLDKYSVDINSGQWSHVQMGSTDSSVLGLVSVTGLESALIAFTEASEIQIWNHEHGFCLTSIDISDVCPQKPLCPLVYSEQGFLFLPIISGKKGAQAGFVIVVNPFLGTSETLTPIHVDNAWTGTSKISMMSQDLLLCRQNNGCVRIWNVHTGRIIASLNDVTVSTMYSKDKLFVVAHKQCVHMYMLNAPHSIQTPVDNSSM